MVDDALVWQGFDQDQELARLRSWLAKVRSRSERKLICSAIEELLHRNLMRYGHCRGIVGFGVIGEWATLEAWAQTIFYPSDPVGYGILRGLCNPRILLVETGFGRGKADLIYRSLLYGCETRTERVSAHNS